MILSWCRLSNQRPSLPLHYHTDFIEIFTVKKEVLDFYSIFPRTARAGDVAAFARLVNLYQDMAVAYARSFLGDHHLAEDAAQEAFIEVYRSLSDLREPAAFTAWLRRIIFKYCDRVLRRKSDEIKKMVHSAIDRLHVKN